MRKNEFTSRLRACLHTLDASEKENVIDFYLEQIDDRIDDGMTEEEAVASLEAPEEIAANVLLSFPQVKQAQEPQRQEVLPEPKRKFSTAAIVLIVILAVLTSFIWLPVILGLVTAVLGIYVGVWAVIFAAGCCSIASLLSCISFLITGFAVIPQSGAAALSHFGIAIACLGLFILLLLATIYSAKYFSLFSLWLAKSMSKAYHNRRTPQQKGVSPSSPYADSVQNEDRLIAPNAKEYESLPLPPFAQKQTEEDQEAKKQPWYGTLKPSSAASLIAFASSIALLIIGTCMCFVPIVKAGGAYELAKQSGYSYETQEQIISADDISQLSLNIRDNQSFLREIKIGLSPDDKIHLKSRASQDEFVAEKQGTNLIISNQVKAQGSKSFLFQNIFLLYAHERDLSNKNPLFELLVPNELQANLVINSSLRVAMENLSMHGSISSDDPETQIVRLRLLNSFVDGNIKLKSENFTLMNSEVSGTIEVRGLVDENSAALFDSRAQSISLSGSGNISFSNIEFDNLSLKLNKGHILGTLPNESTQYKLKLKSDIPANYITDNYKFSGEQLAELDAKLANYGLNKHEQMFNELNSQSDTGEDFGRDVYANLHFSIGEDRFAILTPRNTSSDRQLALLQTFKRFVNGPDGGRAELFKLLAIEQETQPQTEDAPSITIETNSNFTQLGFLGDDKVFGYLDPITGASHLEEALRLGIQYQDSYNQVPSGIIINLDPQPVVR